jgi:hypothetical protein
MAGPSLLVVRFLDLFPCGRRLHLQQGVVGSVLDPSPRPPLPPGLPSLLPRPFLFFFFLLLFLEDPGGLFLQIVTDPFPLFLVPGTPFHSGIHTLKGKGAKRKERRKTVTPRFPSPFFQKDDQSFASTLIFVAIT